jgi:hypothetical protein
MGNYITKRKKPFASERHKHTPAQKAFVLAGGITPANIECLYVGGRHKLPPAQMPLCWRAATRKHKEQFLLPQVASGCRAR